MKYQNRKTKRIFVFTDEIFKSLTLSGSIEDFEQVEDTATDEVETDEIKIKPRKITKSKTEDKTKVETTPTLPVETLTSNDLVEQNETEKLVKDTETDTINLDDLVIE